MKFPGKVWPARDDPVYRAGDVGVDDEKTKAITGDESARIMTEVSPYAIALHALAAVVWVGGMFFAYAVLRPALGSFQGPERLRVWAGVFPRFFTWVWAAVVLLPLTGYMQVFMDYGDFASVGLHINIMHWLGLLMIFLFFLLFFGPYAQFRAAVAAEDWAGAAQHLGRIRQIVLTNLILGLITSALGASGRLWA